MDMPEDVKRRRPYRSERRREQAEETRERVLDAAAGLFGERGFESTTISAIAQAAGVSPETVYGRFGNKRALLGELVRARRARARARAGAVSRLGRARSPPARISASRCVSSRPTSARASSEWAR